MDKTKWINSKWLGRRELIAALQQASAATGRQGMTRAEFLHVTGISRATMERHFASFRDLARAAGQPDPGDLRRLPQDELLRGLKSAFDAEGPAISMRRAAQLSNRAHTTFLKRWGTWRRALGAFIAWVERDDPAWPHIEVLRRRTDPTPPVAWPKSRPADSRRFGELLRFRTLEYSPTDESGVIYLFGIISSDLGFILDGLSKGFPDAEGKRRVGKEWRRVQIEFEHESRNFHAHGHDPAGCDLIVCWEHNWPECPVEVLELRSAVARLAEPNGSDVFYGRLAPRLRGGDSPS